MSEEQSKAVLVVNGLVGLFIANNWLYIAPSRAENTWRLDFRTPPTEEVDHILVYTDVRGVEAITPFDFEADIRFEDGYFKAYRTRVVTEQKLTPEEMATKIEDILSSILILVAPDDGQVKLQRDGGVVASSRLSVKEKPMTIADTNVDRSEEIAKLKGIVAGMTYSQMLDWLENAVVKQRATFKIQGEERREWEFSTDVLPEAHHLVIRALRRLLNDEDRPAPVSTKEEQLRALVNRATDEQVAGWFRQFKNLVGVNFITLGTGTCFINFEREYFQLFGDLIAQRLDARRVTETMLTIDLGRTRPVNPMTALKKFTAALEEFVDKGPREPNLTTSTHTLSQDWIDWYRNVHSCSFALAWQKGAQKIFESEMKPEDLKEYNLIPSSGNPLKVETSRKLEYIQR